ncbi:orotidine-5'-phosphate decarboxylase [Desulforegula conservatrix]|uniref:orotidine-5'-phosphate decarboxylase n=1 Tax=Desulforegula conservatrix TaxID=153026 RepID=UPI00040C0A76|nr:orotidine-5'-phosphate decarboxylase [Desulforegula conservatrix]
MKKPSDYIIFALDVDSMEKASHFARLLSGTVGMFKIGLELFIRTGPDIIKMIREISGAEIFLDLKLHDIPETVKKSVSVISGLDVRFTTLHASGGTKMLGAAAGASGNLDLLAVTVLTSTSASDLAETGHDKSINTESLVVMRAQLAKNAGCSGVVCSALEASMIRQRIGNDFYLVTPGIRPSWEVVKEDDQSRIMTPARAVSEGSDYLVIGRPISRASDPRASALRIADEIAAVL